MPVVATIIVTTVIFGHFNRHIRTAYKRCMAACFRNTYTTSIFSATMSVSVCLSVTEVLWRIIANLGFKFPSQFDRGACGRER